MRSFYPSSHFDGFPLIFTDVIGRDEEEDEEDDQFREIDHEKEDFFRQQRHMKRARSVLA